MFCTQCGKKQPENAKICVACGKPLTRKKKGTAGTENLERAVLRPSNEQDNRKSQPTGTMRLPVESFDEKPVNAEGTVRIPVEPFDGNPVDLEGTIRYVPPVQRNRTEQKRSPTSGNQPPVERKQLPSAKERVEQVQQKQKRKRKKVLLVVISVLAVALVAAAVVIGIMLFHDQKDGGDTKENSQSVSAEKETEETKQQEKQQEAVIPSQMELNGHSYALFNVTEKVAKTWDEAQKYCQSMGGYLAIINSEEENQALYQLVCERAGGYAFFGYSDELSEGTWLWSDGTEDSGYTNWGVDSDGNPEPNSASTKEDFAEFTANRTDGSWNDSTFGQDTFVFICEWDRVNS